MKSSATLVEETEPRREQPVLGAPRTIAPAHGDARSGTRSPRRIEDPAPPCGAAGIRVSEVGDGADLTRCVTVAVLAHCVMDTARGWTWCCCGGGADAPHPEVVIFPCVKARRSCTLWLFGRAHSDVLMWPSGSDDPGAGDMLWDRAVRTVPPEQKNTSASPAQRDLLDRAKVYDSAAIRPNVAGFPHPCARTRGALPPLSLAERRVPVRAAPRPTITFIQWSGGRRASVIRSPH